MRSEKKLLMFDNQQPENVGVSKASDGGAFGSTALPIAQSFFCKKGQKDFGKRMG